MADQAEMQSPESRMMALMDAEDSIQDEVLEDEEPLEPESEEEVEEEEEDEEVEEPQTLRLKVN